MKHIPQLIVMLLLSAALWGCETECSDTDAIPRFSYLQVKFVRADRSALVSNPARTGYLGPDDVSIQTIAGRAPEAVFIQGVDTNAVYVLNWNNNFPDGIYQFAISLRGLATDTLTIEHQTLSDGCSYRIQFSRRSGRKMIEGYNEVATYLFF